MSDIRQIRSADILQAALAELSEKGYDGARMEGIARRAGIGKSTIYEYFPSKLDITSAAVDMVIGQLETQIGVIFSADKPLIEIFTDYLHFGFALLREMGGHVIVMQGAPPVIEIMRGAASRILGVVVREATAAIQRAQARGEVADDLSVDTVVSLLIVLPNPQMLALNLDGGYERRIASLVEVLFQGIGPRGSCGKSD